MKRYVAATGLVAIVILAGAFFWRTVNVQAMDVPINVKDFPEYGVRIIAASDPSFDRTTAPFFKGQPQIIADRVKPFSVLLENVGTLAIVGSTLKWEIAKRDGNTFSQPVSSVNTRALMDGEPKLVQTTKGAAIPPGASRFVSLLGSAAEGQQVDLTRSWLAFRGSQSEGEEFRRALTQGDTDLAFSRSIIGKVLSEATSVTISVDLVFFEDGTYTGQDTRGFFEKVKADIDAQYDLYNEVAAAQHQGRSVEEIFTRLEELAAARSQVRDSNPVIDRYRGQDSVVDRSGATAKGQYSNEYDRSKALYAQELVGMKPVFGGKAAIAQKLELLDKPRKMLKRR